MTMAPTAARREDARRARLQSQVLEDLAAGRLAPAADLLRQLVAEDVFDVRTRLNLGDVLGKLGDVDGAVAHYRAAAAVYDVQGFYLKAVAALKQATRLRGGPRLEVQQHAAALYTRLGLDDEAAGLWRALADAYAAAGDSDAAAACEERLADRDDAAWRAGCDRHALRGRTGAVVVDDAKRYDLADAPPGFRAAVLSAARRGHAHIELRAGGAPACHVVEHGALRWLHTRNGVLVHGGGGVFAREPDPLRALGAVIAEALALPAGGLEALVVFTALGGTARFDGEPPHVEDNAVVFAAVLARGPGRVRIDGETLGVSSA